MTDPKSEALIDRLINAVSMQLEFSGAANQAEYLAAIEAMRAALTPAPAQPEPPTAAGVEPVAWRYREGMEAGRSKLAGEPGPWFYFEGQKKPDCAWIGVEFEPLYATPPTLTDAQCDAIHWAAQSNRTWDSGSIEERRALIRAAAAGGA